MGREEVEYFLRVIDDSEGEGEEDGDGRADESSNKRNDGVIVKIREDREEGRREK